MLRVVIADDHDLFREGLKQLLESVEDITVVGEASDGKQAVFLVEKHRPDVVLMDISMPEMDGIEATETIVARGLNTPVIVLTMYADDEYAIHAIRAGAKGYLLKSSRSDEVIRAIRLAAAGGSAIDPALGAVLMREFQRLLNRSPGEAKQQLSSREQQFLELLVRGHNNRQIASELELAESTVKNNLSALFQKIGVRDRTQAVLYAISNGLVSPPSDATRT
ncbi:MAG TPA: response regulator transcription factor [Thermomicrobiales bacterium]|nr:response regulator transcription factor [Thermomicrobiales bacterium]